MNRYELVPQIFVENRGFNSTWGNEKDVVSWRRKERGRYVKIGTQNLVDLEPITES